MRSVAEQPVTLVVEQLRRAVQGGIGTYTLGLMQGLREMGDDAPPIRLAASRGPELGYPTLTSRLPSRALTRLWDRGLGAGLVKGSRLVHATSMATPYPAGTPVVVTVHDVAWREAPDTFPPRGRRWHEAALQRCARHAAMVVAPSERTAAQLAGTIPSSRVSVIAEGADHLPAPDHEAAGALLRSLGVTTPYLLSVSTLEPRKNLARVISAYTRARLPEPWPLVVVGPAGWGDQLQPVPGVKLAGHAPPAVLAALYSAARLLVYVPLLEGWGLPPVEAMTAGIPVVASPMPSIGNAAWEVDPLDVEAIAHGIEVVAADGAALIEAGRLRARELTWERAARAHVALWASL
jgi:glycosyltransferase involved in cell wall biosynthesis